MGRYTISGGITGRSSQDHWPKSASQILVNTRVAGMPPRALIHSAALAMCGALGRCPASRSAT